MSPEEAEVVPWQPNHAALVAEAGLTEFSIDSCRLRQLREGSK